MDRGSGAHYLGSLNTCVTLPYLPNVSRYNSLDWEGGSPPDSASPHEAKCLNSSSQLGRRLAAWASFVYNNMNMVPKRILQDRV